MKKIISQLTVVALLMSAGVASATTYMFRASAPGVRPPPSATVPSPATPPGTDPTVPPAPPAPPAVPAVTKTYAQWDRFVGNLYSSDGLTLWTTGNSWNGAIANMGKSSGKWYWEVTVGGAAGYSIPDGAAIGVRASLNGSYTGSQGAGVSYYVAPGLATVYNDGTVAYPGMSPKTGDTIGVALDMDARTITFFANCAPVAEAYPIIDTSPTLYAAVSTVAAFPSIVTNFGETTFKCGAPSGYNSGLYEPKS